MIELVDTNDSRAVRNKNNVLGFYDLVIDKKKSEDVHRFMSPRVYPTQTRLIANGPDRAGGSSSARSPRNVPRRGVVVQ